MRIQPSAAEGVVPAAGRPPRRLAMTNIGIALLILPAAAGGASGTIVPTDRNHAITMLDARSDGVTATLLYYTHPAERQAHIVEPCAINYYLVTLAAGLSAPAPEPLARDHCSTQLHFPEGALLDTGEALLIVEDRVEVWRPGDGKLREWRLGDNAATRDLDASTAVPVTHVDISRNGDIVVAGVVRVPTSGHRPNTNVIAVGLAADGALRWRAELSEPGVSLAVKYAWAGADGSALLYVSAIPADSTGLPDVEAPPGTVVSDEDRIYFVSASGQARQPMLLQRALLPDFEALARASDPGAAGQAFPQGLEQLLQQAAPETLTKFVIHRRDGGGYDVLLDRRSPDAARDGHRYYRLDANGTVAEEISVTASIDERGLTDWSDFFVRDDRLTLHGSVIVSRDPTWSQTLSQNSVSDIDLSSGNVVTRLLPLDERYLDAFLNSRDEQIQTLVNLPGGTPERLTRLGGTPLAISIGWLDGRQALRLDEVTGQLALYSRTRDTELGERGR